MPASWRLTRGARLVLAFVIAPSILSGAAWAWGPYAAGEAPSCATTRVDVEPPTFRPGEVATITASVTNDCLRPIRFEPRDCRRDTLYVRIEGDNLSAVVSPLTHYKVAYPVYWDGCLGGGGSPLLLVWRGGSVSRTLEWNGHFAMRPTDEPAPVPPGEYRVHAYGSSCDPLRCAAAWSAETTLVVLPEAGEAR